MKAMEDFNQMLKENDIRLSNEINKLMQIRQNKIDCAILTRYLIKDIEPLIEKLNLTIHSFSMNTSEENILSRKGKLNIRLVSNGKFRFLGENAKYDTLEKKTSKIEEKVQELLKDDQNDLECYINPYSMKVARNQNENVILMEISYKF
jgi:Txe/YoeB family toxin of Txe-Axe toxin-antitoxin module